MSCIELIKNLKEGIDVICTMLATNYCAIKSKYGYSDYKYPRLSNYIINYLVGNGKAHDSKYDVINLAKCFFKILHDNNIQIIGKKENWNLLVIKY